MQKSGFVVRLTIWLPASLEIRVVFKANGALQRRSPTGGSAYGTPRYATVSGYDRFPLYLTYPRSTTFGAEASEAAVATSKTPARRVKKGNRRIVTKPSNVSESFVVRKCTE